MSWLAKQAGWLEYYNESTNTYANRIAVRAILVSVQKDKLENVPKVG